MTVQLVIFAPARLHRIAWLSLMTNQPGIGLPGATGELNDIPNFIVSDQTTILVDLPSVKPDQVSQLHEIAPECGLLLLVENFDLDEIVNALRVGGTGFISRDSTVGDLSRAIIATARGEIVLPPELATRALVSLARSDRQSEVSGASLTEREQDVLKLLAQGLTNKDIAQTLILSVRTVEAHLHNVYGKMGVNSRTEAALWAVNHGYSSPD